MRTYPVVAIKLPATTKRQDELYISPSGGWMSMTLDFVGERAASHRRWLSGKIGDSSNWITVSGGSWSGWTQAGPVERDLRDARHYYMFGKEMAVTMMISWPRGKSAAKAEAEEMVRCALWSLRKAGSGGSGTSLL